MFSRYTIRGVGISGRATVPSDEGGTFTSCIDKGRGYSMVSVLARPHRTKGVALSSVDDGHIERRGWHYYLWMTGRPHLTLELPSKRLRLQGQAS